MKATLWISGRTCRAIVTDAEGRIVDLNDDWNNIASMQSWLYDTYPEAKQKTVRDPEQARELDKEWGRCKTGNG
jgi:hypothetical protein